MTAGRVARDTRIRVGISGLAAKSEGSLTYLDNLLPEFARMASEAQFVVYVNATAARSLRERLSSGANGLRLEVLPGARHRGTRLLLEHTELPRRLRLDGIDVLFSAAPSLPLRCRPAAVVAVRNMEPYCPGVERLVPTHERMRYLYIRRSTAWALHRADRVILVAESTRSLLTPYHQVPPGRTVVIQHGCNPIFRPMPKAKAAAATRELWGLREPFILYVSKTHPYKNHVELVRAFALLRLRFGRDEHLVVAGGKQEPYFSKIADAARSAGVAGAVHFLGDVPYDLLPALYNACEVFVYPSTCEACPNIVIEALGCGVPMAVSSIPAVRELCGDAAMYFDPADPESAASTLGTLLSDARMRRQYADRARRRSERFSWQRTAERTLEVLLEAARWREKGEGADDGQSVR